MKRLGLLLVVASCSQSRTELMVGVVTDLKAPDAIDAAQLVVTRTKDGFVEQQVNWDISGLRDVPFNLPGSYGIYSDGQETQLSLELTGIKGSNVVVTRKAILNLVSEQTLFFRMGLTAGCIAKTDCAADQSCVEGVCQDVNVNSRQLPNYKSDLVTEVTCVSGATYIDTSTGAPMPQSSDAAMCPADLCVEGTCLEPPQSTGSGGGSGSGNSGGVGAHFHYVVNRLIWPTNSTQARADGFDLNGDGTIDNQLGMVFSTFSSMGFDTQTASDASIASGGSITLADLQATSLSDATGSTFTLYVGQNPMPAPCNGSGDTLCGHHLDGTGSFTAAAVPRDTPIPGGIASSVFTGGPGHLTVPLYLSTEVPTQVTLLAARAKVTATTGGLMQGTLGGALAPSDIQRLYPGMQMGFATSIARDCSMLTSPPGCGCTSSSQGATIIGFFDANHDCAVTTTEIQSNSLIQSLFSPDVMVENQPALSVGFAFTAVDATFAP